MYTDFLASFLPCFLFGKTQSKLKDIDAGAYSYFNRDVSPFTNHKFKSQSNYSLVYLLYHFLLWVSGLFKTLAVKHITPTREGLSGRSLASP